MLTLLVLSGAYQIYRKKTGRELKPVLLLAEKLKAVAPTKLVDRLAIS